MGFFEEKHKVANIVSKAQVFGIQDDGLQVQDWSRLLTNCNTTWCPVTFKTKWQGQTGPSPTGKYIVLRNKAVVKERALFFYA